MKDIVSEYQEKFRRNRQYLRRYTALLLALAFTTTLFVNWQLRSVGIAKTADYQCGLEEHDHTDACYARVLVCGYEEGEPEYDAAVPDASFDSAFAVDAGNDPDISTYAAEPEPEYIFVPHEHTDDCWQEVRTLTCYEEEHEHTDDCFDPEDGSLICDLFEHVHDDNCYNIEYELVCGLEEGELVEEPNPDYVAADEDAFAVFDSGISALPAMDLKPVVADDSSPDVPVHHHTDACYEEELICGLPEHHHTVNCLADPLDDVEDEDAWLSQTGTSLTGLWTDDLLAVAESQLDYEQSEKNFKLDDADGTTVHYYTRYGAWYGNSYGPWDVMFLSYCLNYAGIPQSAIPQVSSVQSLHSQLRSALYNEETGSGYAMDFAGDLPSDAAMPGDIVIYNGTVTKAVAVESQPPQVQDDSADADIALLSMDAAATTGTAPHIEEYTVDTSTVGIVSDVDEDSGTLTVISGDVDGKVAKVTLNASQVTTLVSVANAQQAGYGVATLDFTVEGDDGAITTITGLDALDYLTALKVQRKSGIEYADTNVTTLSELLHSSLTVTDIPAQTIQENGYCIHVKLPKSFDVLDDELIVGKLEDTGNYGTCGSYQLLKGTDGCWYAVLRYYPDYIQQKEAADAGMDTSGAKVTSTVAFDFLWNQSEITSTGKNEIKVKENYTLDITINPDKTPDEDEKDNKKYELDKSVKSPRYDGSDAYLDYTVTLVVKNEQPGPLTLADSMTLPGGVDAEYVDTSLKLSMKKDTTTLGISWADAEGETGVRKITLGSDGSTIAAGTYYIRYTVKLKDFGKTAVDGDVVNKIEIPDTTISDDAKKSVKTGTISKSGTVNNDGTVTWTVDINNGDALRYLKNAVFTDTISADQKLDPEALTVIKTAKGGDPGEAQTIQLDGTVPGASYTGNTISYKLEDGYNSYKITYTTTYTGSIPVGGVDVSNTGNVKDNNGLDGSATDTKHLDADILHKQFVSSVKNGDESYTLHWKSTIDATDVSTYTFYDYSGTFWYENAHHKAQEIVGSSIVVKSTGKEYNAADLGGALNLNYSSGKFDGSGNDLGLFSIVFSKVDGITGPLTIEYDTTVSLNGLPDKFSGGVVNSCQLNEGEVASAQTNITNEKDQQKYFAKFAGSGKDDWSNFGKTSGSMSFNDLNGKISWRILLNEENVLTYDPSETRWTVTDTLPAGLTLDTESIWIQCDSWYEPQNGNDYTYTTAKNEKGETILTFTLYRGTFADGSALRSKINIYYEPSLDPAYIDSDSMSFTNHATFERGSTKSETSFTETVNTKVIGKSGYYNDVTRELTYQVWVNPYGATLFNGKDDLTLYDYMNVPSDLEKTQRVKLQGITVFHAELQDGKLVTTDGGTELTAIAEPSKPYDDKDAPNHVDTGSFYAKFSNSTNSPGDIKSWTKIPDATPLVLVYRYSVNTVKLVANQTFPFTNTVTINGEEKWSSKDNNTSFTSSSSGTSAITYTSDRLVLTKYSQTPDNVLSGAKFRLAHYDADSNSWVNDGSDFVTNAKGTYTLDSLKRNTLYRLREIEAPEGYLLPDDPNTYFAISENADYAPPLESGYNADNYQLYLASQNNADAQALADEGDDIPSLAANNVLYYTFHAYVNNLPKSSTDKTGSLTVSKQWKDSLGNDVAGSTTGLPAVRLTLTRLTKDGDTAIQTVIDTVTLNAGNGWTHTWNNLITRDNITYTVTEEALTGYTASYTFNDKALEAGASITVTPDSTDSLVVTNQADQSGYKLPSTGGAGTKLYTTGGVALMLAALVCGFCTKRRRERRAH